MGGAAGGNEVVKASHVQTQCSRRRSFLVGHVTEREREKSVIFSFRE